MAALLDRVHQRAAHSRGCEASRHGADAFERVNGLRRMRSDFGERFVSEDAVSRDVAFLRLALAPCGDRRQHGEEAFVGRARLEPPPGAVWVEAVERWV